MEENKGNQNYPQEQNTEESDPTAQIFVGGCDPNTQEEDLRNYFSQFGEIAEIRVMKDKMTRKYLLFKLRAL